MELEHAAHLCSLDDPREHSHIRIDPDARAAHVYMQPYPRPCFTPSLLKEILAFQLQLKRSVQIEMEDGHDSAVEHLVFESATPGIFNLGGDLELFTNAIQAGDRAALMDYATMCIRAAYNCSVFFDLPVTTIALVQGTAQGGGFEGALSCNVIIAERGTQMGFPEVLFNLFPGMGAYSFLSRRTSPAVAERLILTGQFYSAERLYEMGVVDILADRGHGHDELKKYLAEGRRRSNARRMVRYARNRFSRVPWEELRDIADLWVDAALGLKRHELRTMERLVRLQTRQASEPSSDIPDDSEASVGGGDLG